ncbi:hypothetical protein BASA81_000588 [Batrachochytrium salamandrivorans]|nr:hypothetical protein BASA81_000588 [Batrachochytrium salamandrivorans]
MFKSHLGRCPSDQGPKGSSRLLVRGASSNTSSVYSGEQSGFQNLGDGVVIIVTVVRGQIATTAQKMYTTLRGLGRLALTSKSAAPKPAAVLAIETSIAKLAFKVDALETKLNNAEAEVAKWSGIKFNPPPETNMSQANEALKFYTEQAAAAQTALNEANALLLEKERLLVEERRLLDNEQKRQHELAMAAQNGKVVLPPPFANLNSALGKVQLPRLSRPTVFELPRLMDFVETEESKSISECMIIMARTLPNQNIRNLGFPVVRGIMGCGKSTSAGRAMQVVCDTYPDRKFIQCYVRLEELGLLREGLEAETLCENVLATVLIYCFTGRSVGLRNAPALAEVGELINKQFGSRYLLLHIDEFQVSPKIAGALVLACCSTIMREDGIFVIPVVSGITDLRDQGVPASSWSAKYVLLGALPLGQLWSTFLKALELPLTTSYQDDKNLACLFKDCGGYANQVVAVVEAYRHFFKHSKRESGSVLTKSDAQRIFELTMESLRQAYGDVRWHEMFSNTFQRGEDKNLQLRDSFEKTLRIIRVVMLHVLAKKTIPNLDCEIIADVSWEKCKKTGMVDLVQVQGGYVAKCSLFALLTMNHLAAVIPRAAQLELPFEDDWQTLERLALVSLMVHVQACEAGSLISLEACRPGAFVVRPKLAASPKTASTVEIVVPKTVAFAKIEVTLDAAELVVGKFVLCAANQPAVDGVVLLDGFVDGKARKILVLSQSKAQGPSPKTGLLSDSTMTSHPIKQIMEQIRAIKLPAGVQGAFVVYDVFSNRFGAQNPMNPEYFELTADEALIATTNTELDSVLGGLAARRRTDIVN